MNNKTKRGSIRGLVLIPVLVIGIVSIFASVLGVRNISVIQFFLSSATLYQRENSIRTALRS